MTITVPFFFVDVFADAPLTGNPVALVPDADELPIERMRAIAREFNQSETTFLLSPSRPAATRRLRSFTPSGAEVFGAGHNALGAWIWLAEAGGLPDAPGGRYCQEIGDDLLPVQVRTRPGTGPAVTMEQSAPRFGDVVTARAELAASLGITEDELVGGRAARVVSTGAGHLLVPVRDRDVVDRAAPDTARLAAALRRVGGEGCYVYSLDTVDDASAAYARFFNPTMGIWEDPATGTAAGPLGAFLVAEGLVPPGTLAIEQGHALGRPSRILIHVEGQSVRVSGSGLVVAEGSLHL